MLRTYGAQAEGPLHSPGYGAYQRIQTETSSCGELVVMLYNALVTDLQRAEQAFEADDVERAHASLLRAQDIVMELLASLDMGTGDLALRLSELYHYVYERLMHANVKKDAAAVREVVTLVTRIRDAWAQVVNNAPADPAAARAKQAQA